MPATIVVDDAAARALLLKTGLSARNHAHFYRTVLDPSVTAWLKDRFASEGRSGGPPWAPLRPLTVLLRGRPGHGRAGKTKVGQDVRRMWASFTKSGGPDSVRVIQPQYYERGSDNPAALRFHSGYRSFVFGRPTGRDVPARPIIPDEIPGSLIRRWQIGLVRHLERGK